MKQTMEQIAEHSLYKSAAPLALAALIGCTGWLFMSTIELKSQVRLLTEGKIISLAEDINDLELDVKDIQDEMSEVKIDSRLIEKIQTTLEYVIKHGVQGP